MALTGVHIAFGSGGGGAPYRQDHKLLGEATVSQTMASAGTSTIVAPDGPAGSPAPVLSISSSAPIFYAVGTTPDATNGPRRYLDPAFGTQDIFVNVGDKVAWILVP